MAVITATSISLCTSISFMSFVQQKATAVVINKKHKKPIWGDGGISANQL